MTSPQRKSTLEDRWNLLLRLTGKERKDVSKYPGITSSSLTNWLSRDQHFTHRAVNHLVNWAAEHGVEGLTYEWLNYAEGPAPYRVKDRAPPTLPLEVSKVAAIGEAEEPEVIEDFVRFFYLPDFSREKSRFIDLPSTLLGDSLPRLFQHGIRVYINPDDIMRGEVEKGDLVFVDTDERNIDVDGLYACKLGGIPFVRRITNLGGGVIRLTGNQYSIELSGAKLNNLQLGGRVVERIGRTSYR